jgi:hypothetical protein
MTEFDYDNYDPDDFEQVNAFMEHVQDLVAKEIERRVPDEAAHVNALAEELVFASIRQDVRRELDWPEVVE